LFVILLFQLIEPAREFLIRGEHFVQTNKRA
jgi:hypothetical protein